MSASRYILAGILAAVGAPAVTYAASAGAAGSGLTQYDLEHGETPLLSERAASAATPKDRQARSGRRTVAKTSDAQARHDAEMGTGVVPATNGATPEGSK